ncbi:type 1 periplasmic-binding domain-containing protein [Streptomyces odonnellii]|uniref:ABC transporter substrate-binding protein n=1 Tax=Streptomyces odonnellii TaxID=1417980 RepID=UPI000AB08A95|nr:ABC transporter substrate-binding protein [Streptomyces odonnellii]
MTTGDSQSRIPAYPGVERFVDAFDKLVAQPRRSRSRVPVVLLHEPDGGDAGRRIVAGLRSRMRGRSEVLAPHAYIPQIPDGADPPPLELFEHLTLQLAETMPPGTGELRLHSYRLLRSVVTAPAIEGLMERRHAELRNHCYAEHRNWSRTAQTLWWLGGRDQASGGTLLELLWNFVAGPLFQRLPRALFGWRANRRMLGRARSRSWYAEWVRRQHGSPPTDFFRSALDLVHGEPGNEPERMDRVLMHALLADLDQASRARLLNPWRRRRTSRFVLLFDGAGPADSRVQRFLRELRSAVEDLRCTSVFAVAGGVLSLASRIPDINASGLAHAGAELINIERRGMTPGQPTGIVVPVAEGPEDDQAAVYWLGRWPTLVTPSPRWGPGAEVAGVLGIGAVALALVVGLILVPDLGSGEKDDPCQGSTFLGTDGQCVGVAEGAAEFGNAPSEQALRAVLQQIERQNTALDGELADRPADDPRPGRRTVVYFGPLTGGENAEDPVRGGTLAELRGIALAQRHINTQALRSGERVPLRVLTANAGDRFKDAPAVAERVAELAASDPSIAGVVGFGQSRRNTYDAIRVLDKAGIPMVGTSGTADELLRQGEHYYQTAPTDARAAELMAVFASNARMTAGGQKARRVSLVADATDAYSNSLAASFRSSYGQGRTDVLLYTPTDAPEPGPVPGALGGRPVATVEDLAREVCGAVREDPRTAVVWSARASQFQVFLAEIGRISGDCPEVGVLAGDDVINLLTDDRRPLDDFKGLTLFYVSHGHAPSLVTRSPEAAAFLAAYDRAYGGDRSARTRAMREDGHVALAWDALRYLAEGIDQAWRTTGGQDDRLNRVLLQGVLYQGLGGGGFDGATRRIDAHGAAGGGRVTEDKLLAVVRGSGDGPATELLCGRVSREDERTVWGPKDDRHPCP